MNKVNLKEAAKQNAEKEMKAVLSVPATAERSFIAGAEWKHEKAIEAFRIMGEETRFDIPTDVLGKAREIFERELNL